MTMTAIAEPVAVLYRADGPSIWAAGFAKFSAAGCYKAVGQGQTRGPFGRCRPSEAYGTREAAAKQSQRVLRELGVSRAAQQQQETAAVERCCTGKRCHQQRGDSHSATRQCLAWAPAARPSGRK